MSRHVWPYVGARVIRSVSGVVTNGERVGHTITATLYQDMASHGYKTGYEAVRTLWLEVTLGPLGAVKGGRQCWRYSGKRCALAEGADWDKVARDVQEACATVAAEVAP